MRNLFIKKYLFTGALFSLFLALPAVSSGQQFPAAVFYTVDDEGTKENSIVLDSSGNVHFSYADFDEVYTKYELKYATNSGTPGGCRSGFKCVLADSHGQHDVGRYSSIALDSSENIHISYKEGGDMGYVTNRGVTPGNGNCGGSNFDCTVIYTPSSLLGWKRSIAVDSGDNVHIVFREGETDTLVYATNRGVTPGTGTCDDPDFDCISISSAGNPNVDTSIAVDSADRVHISYYDSSDSNLKYVTNRGVTPGTGTCDHPDFDCIVIDSSAYSSCWGGGGGDTDNTCNENSIAVDSSDKVHISYEKTNGGLYYATNITGTWVTRELTSSGAHHNSIAVDSSGNVHISYGYGNLNYVTNSPFMVTPGAGNCLDSDFACILLEQFSNTLTEGTSIVWDPAGLVHISYTTLSGTGNTKLKYAKLPLCNDGDGDGYGNTGSIYCSNGTMVDCDDTDSTIYPGAPDTWYDGVDQNCDGLNDYDQDMDTYVDESYSGEAGGTAPNTGDCNDTDGTINPGATDTWYDGVDQNCDGLNDYDQDMDAHVHSSYPGEAGGTASYIGDCNDTDAGINPGVTEGPPGDVTCSDLTDNDCDSDMDSLDRGCFIAVDPVDPAAKGRVLWTRQEGTASSDWANGVAVDGSGNIYVTGRTNGDLAGPGTKVGGYDIFLLKYDSSGALQWTRQMGTSSNDEAYGVAVDGSGNIYVTGRTGGDLDGAGPGTWAGLNDIFLLKYDSSGALQWTRQMGSSNSDEAYGVAVDGSGNIYVTGRTGGDLDGAGSGTWAGLNDIFLLKYDGSGALQWTRQTGTSNGDEAYGVAVDGSGNIYVTGFTGGDLDGAGPGTWAGSFDIFLLKYNSSGGLLWIRQMGSSGWDSAEGLAVDGAGNIYVTGWTTASLDGQWYEGSYDIFMVKYSPYGVKQWTFQSGTGNNDRAQSVAVDNSGFVYVTGETSGDLEGPGSNQGESDIFLLKYDGLYEWASQPGTVSFEEAMAVAVDSNGNVYVTGFTDGDLDGAGPGTWAGSYDIFLMKYDSSGALQWTRQTGTSNSDEAYGVAVDGNGNVYVTGYTVEDLDGAGPGTWAGLKDIFLLKYDSGGNLLWTKQMGTSSNDEAYGVAVDGSGNIYVTGRTRGDLDGAGPGTWAGLYDIFLLKYDSSGALQWTRQMGTSDSDYGNSVAVDGNGNVYVTGSTGEDLDGAGPGTWAGYFDIFLLKYDSGGNLQWTRQMGTTYFDIGNSVAVDGYGNVYVTGSTGEDLDGAGPGTWEGGYDIFLLKYDSSGNLQWTRQMGTMGTSSNDEAYGVAIDGSGEVYVTGRTNGDLEGPGSNQGEDDIFLMKYDSSGNLLWTRQMGTANYDEASSIALNQDGAAYISGYVGASFAGNMLFGDFDIILIKYGHSIDSVNPTGSLLIESGDALTSTSYSALATSCTDAGGCTGMRFSNDGIVWSEPEPYSDTRASWDLTDPAYGGTGGDGTKTVYVKFMDNTGNWSVAYSDDIILDITLPTGTVTIESGNAYSDDSVVTLDMTGNDLNGVAEMQFSNDGVSWSNPDIFNPSAPWSLTDPLYGGSPGDGVKTVYAKVKDNAGNWSDPFNDDIILDESTPATIAAPPGFLYQSVQTVTLSCDDGGGSGCTATYYCTGAGCNPTTLYSTPFNFSENTTLRYYSEDALGNTEAVREDVYTFVQGATDLSIELSAPRILSGGTVDAVGQLMWLGDPADEPDRNGLTIRFEITGPSPVPQPTQTTTYSDSGLYSHTISGFITEGIYDIKAVFDGTGLMLPDESPIMSVYVGPSAGYAIIVEGKIPSGQGLASHNKTTNRIYTKLKARGFSDADIYYFNYDTGQTGVDETPTKAGIQAAVEYWARFKMNDIAAPLYIIMTDHGNATAGIYLENESITPTDLNTWLDTLEGGLNAAALLKKRVTILGACYSGAFIPVVSGSGRVVISSAAADEVSHKGPYENDGGTEIRSGEFFMEELFTYLERGETIRDAFIMATERTEIFTRRDSVSGKVAPYYDEAIQHPLLDDDGDGYGSNILSIDGDGNEVKDLYLGVGDYYVPNRASNPAELTGVTETVYLSTTEDTYTMWAEVNDDAKVDGGRIWYEVRKPSKSLPGGSGNEQVAADYVYNFLLNTGPLHWEKQYSDFDEYGKYEIFYFVRDFATQKVSPMKRGVVYRDDPANLNYPDTFNLISPADGSEQRTKVILQWESSGDADGDEVTYTVMISDDNGVTFYPVMEGIETTWVLLGKNGELSDLTTYYWKVVAVDFYGKQTESNQAWSFHTDDGNDIYFGVVEGMVVDESTGDPLGNVPVVVGSDSGTSHSGTGYYYVEVSMNAETESHTMSVTGVSGYSNYSSSVTVTSGESVWKNVSMEPQCIPATEVCDGVDNDCDSLVDDADPDVVGQSTWYLDGDSDTYGNSSAYTPLQCFPPTPPPDYVLDDTDCDDSDANIYPGGPPVRNATSLIYYDIPPMLQTAYNAAGEGDVIQSKGSALSGDLDLSGVSSVILQGGCNCDFSVCDGTTTINGNVTINNGTLEIDSGTLEIQ